MTIALPADLVRRLREARHVVVLSGAGMSAESGVPTFRDAQTGLWARFRPEELATPQAFAADARRVWDWYEWRRELVGRSQPNPGHLALAEMERHVPRLTLITQNVDGLHQTAGSTHVLELHGSLLRNKCFEGGHPVDRWPATDERPPRCPLCGGRVRPDVVWFGESLPEANLRAATQAAEACDLLMSVGTSSVVEPAATLPYVALRAGATIVEVNPEHTPLTPHANFVLSGPSGEVLPALVAAVWPQ